MNDKLISSLRICGRINSANDNCIAFHDGSCEAEPVCMYELMGKAADTIEELQGRVKVLEKVADKWCEAVPKWIQVSERLPEEHGWCVACVFYRGIQWGDIKTKGFTSVCPAYYFEGTFYKVSSEAEVTHWMPLPDPPKEG